MTPFKYIVAVVRSGLLIAATLAGGMLAAQEKKADPLDWPHWRGPEMNGISREKGLVSSWSPDGENVLWKVEEYGSRSTPIVMNGKLYTLCRLHPETTKEQERVVCLDAATGAKIWENAFNVFLTDAPAERVAWSNVAGDPETGNVFALGICDYFQCIDGATGKTLWSHSLSEEYGMISTYGGRTNMPLVFEDLVIISGVMTGWGEHAVPAHRFVAFDKRTGQAVWLTSTRLRPLDTTYSTPVLGVFNGQAAFVAGAGDGSVYAIQPRTGKIIWNYDASIRGINTPPVIAGNMVFCGHSEENLFDTTIMGAVFAIDGTGTGNLTDIKSNWLQPTKMVGRSQPLFVNDRLYVVDDSATLMVLDPKTGKEIGKQKLGRSMFGSPIYADGKIFLGEANGLFYILEPTEKGVKIVHRARVEGAMIQGSPIVSHGRLYIPTNTALYCVGKKDHTPTADPAPTREAETASAADQKPAQLQLVPVESLLKPGQKQQFQARLYNANGRYLKTVPATFELKGPGKIDDKGQFTAPADAGHAATFVSAKVGELTGTARIRTIPPMPWSFDFNDQQIPLTWMGTAYRHISLDDDLLQSLKAKNPRAAGLYIYLTTVFTNSGAPALKIEDVTPRRSWTELLRYFSLDGAGKPATIDDAKKEFDAALQLLVEEKVLESVKWADDGAGGVELSVKRGKRDAKGNGVLVKITTIPKGTRSQGWMGLTSLHDYTVQADLRGSLRNDKLPAMGVINQRYTLDLMGASQQLQIRSWAAQLELRFAKTIPFAWKPDVWYTMKFQSQTKDGKVTLRGKVWPRGDKEPADWTIEATDEVPNLGGSPGLFGNASDAEVFIDNVKVTENQKS